MKKILSFGESIVEIIQDGSAESPRSWDNLGTCLFFGKHSGLGDKNNIDADDYRGWEAMEHALLKKEGVAVLVPVYMYNHSYTTISTTPFNCKWDSWQLGFIVAYADDIKKEFGVKRVGKKLKEKITRILTSEIELLNQWLIGDTFGFSCTDGDGKEDSCWGFYGDSADNGIFDHLNIEGLTFDKYKEQFELANFEY